MDPSTNTSDDVPMSSTSSQIPIALTDTDSNGPAVRPGDLPLNFVPSYGSGGFGNYQQTMVPDMLMDVPAPAASLFSGGDEAIFAELGGAWWNRTFADVAQTFRPTSELTSSLFSCADIFNDNDVLLRENYFAPQGMQL